MDPTPPASRPPAACPDPGHPLPPQPGCLPGRLGTASVPVSFADLEKSVEVGAVGRDPVVLFEIRLDGLEELHPPVGRIADHNVEAVPRENLWEGGPPVERLRRVG